MGNHYLEPLFSPQSILILGDRPEAANIHERILASGYKGEVNAANLLSESPLPHADLALISSPSKLQKITLKRCAEAGIKTLLILQNDQADSDVAEFRPTQTGATNTPLQPDHPRAFASEIPYRNDVATLKPSKSQQFPRFLGPNSLGLIRPSFKLNASLLEKTPRIGGLALVSESAAVCCAVVDRAESLGVGFSAVVSLGQSVDIQLGEILEYLAFDPQTKSILLYVESVYSARQFMTGLRRAARLKPIIVVKARRQTVEGKPARSHAGALVGADDVFNAALARAGVVRADTLGQLFAVADLLASTQRAKGNRLAVISNGAGPAILAIDHARIKNLTLSPAEGVVIPAKDPQSFAQIVQTSLANPNIDGVLVLLCPLPGTQSQAIATLLSQLSHPKAKPLLTCFLGGEQMQQGREVLAQQHIPSFSSPERAVDAFAFLAAYQHNQTLLWQPIGPLLNRPKPDLGLARSIIQQAQISGRNCLDYKEGKALLRAFHIPTLPSFCVESLQQAYLAAEEVGYPVVLKLVSPQISHKTDIGAVRLSISDREALQPAFADLMDVCVRNFPEARLKHIAVEPMIQHPIDRELLMGLVNDPVFGPAITFGAGGTATEILRDRAIALPPLNANLCETLIQQTQVSKRLGQFRNLPPLNREPLIHALLSLSEMACELAEIAELDINPLVLGVDGLLALDVHIILKPASFTAAPYSHLAIHPYPGYLVREVPLADGKVLTLRPIRPEDAEIEQAFTRKLTPEAKYFRFMNSLMELSPDQLVRFTQLDYAKDMAFIAVTEQDGVEIPLGVARYFAEPDGESAEFALVVADEWRKRGIGTLLLETLSDAAQQQGYRRLNGEVLAGNHRMLALMSKLGFSLRKNWEEPDLVRVSKELG